MTYLQLHVGIALIERSVMHVGSVGMDWVQHFDSQRIPLQYRRIALTQLGFLSCRLTTKAMWYKQIN